MNVSLHWLAERHRATHPASKDLTEAMQVGLHGDMVGSIVCEYQIPGEGCACSEKTPKPALSDLASHCRPPLLSIHGGFGGIDSLSLEQDLVSQELGACHNK